MTFKVTRVQIYLAYHMFLLCFLVYITMEINRIDGGKWKHSDLVGKGSHNQQKARSGLVLDKLKTVAGGSDDNLGDSLKIQKLRENVGNVNANNGLNSVSRFVDFQRKRRSLIKLEGLQRGLFANFINRTYLIRHEQLIEEIVPSLIALEDIVIREAQKTKLALTRVNIKLRELELLVNNLPINTATDLPEVSTQMELSTPDPEVLDVSNTTYFAYNTADEVDGSKDEVDGSKDEVDGSGEVEDIGPRYITVLPPVYNGSQEYFVNYNTALQPLYTIIEELESKVSKHGGFNAQSDVHHKNMMNSINRLEDLVDDEHRKLRQLATESSYHRTRMAVIENLLNNLDGTEMRINSRISRLEDEQTDFFDMLDEHSDIFRDLKRDIYKATQTTKDLEGADTVHERDTRSIQQNLAGLQQIISGMYGTVDSSISDLRQEVRGELVRLCHNNKLFC